ncbi:MAG: SCP2 sterol-binding domain-containing protein [Candidatus Methylomirabilis sp.]|nr:SCP2 sterol-binding domain-containing protein [Deltaproteobacteria bacterium]
MPRIDAPMDISPADYFANHVPQAVEATLKERPAAEMEGIEFKVAFEVEGHGAWTVRIADGARVALEAEDHPDAHLRFRFDERAFRRSQLGEGRRLDVIEMIHGDRRRFDKLPSTAGTLHLELTAEEPEPHRVSIVFAGGGPSQVTLAATLDDFCDVVERKANPVMLFMSQRLRARGNLGYLLKTQQIL